MRFGQMASRSERVGAGVGATRSGANNLPPSGHLSPALLFPPNTLAGDLMGGSL